MARTKPATADSAGRLNRLRRLAWLIDGSLKVPGTRYRVGLNSVIGLVPVGGDAVLAAISLYIVDEAHCMGGPPRKLARMLGNVGIEVVGGSIPIIGDVFDMALQANLRNMKIVEQHMAGG